MKIKSLLAASALLAAAAVNAQVTYSGGALDNTIAGYNPDPAGLTPSFSAGVIDALIGFGTFPVTFTYLGKEAQNIDQLILRSAVDTVVLDNQGPAPQTYGPFAVPTGTPTFLFRDVTDSQDAPNGGDANAFASYAVLGTFSDAGGFVAWKGYNNEFDLVLGFNDGDVIDADYDDLVVGITAVPEPSTYALMLAGLGAIGYMARRRKSA